MTYVRIPSLFCVKHYLKEIATSVVFYMLLSCHRHLQLEPRTRWLCLTLRGYDISSFVVFLVTSSYRSDEIIDINALGTFCNRSVFVSWCSVLIVRVLTDFASYLLVACCIVPD